MDTEKWAKAFTHEIREKWEQFKQQDPMFESGFQVFYSPVKFNPELLILGFNPGGTVDDFDLDHCEDVPSQHSYFLYDYRLAKKMRSLFDGANLTSLLKDSVKTNMIFFRSKSIEDWNKIEPSLRKEAETFCFSKVKEMISVLQPKRVLAEGIFTYEYLRRVLELDRTREKTISKDRALVLTNQTVNIKILGMIHPSGARISNEEWDLICGEVKKFVA